MHVMLFRSAAGTYRSFNNLEASKGKKVVYLSYFSTNRTKLYLDYLCLEVQLPYEIKKMLHFKIGVIDRRNCPGTPAQHLTLHGI